MSTVEAGELPPVYAEKDPNLRPVDAATTTPEMGCLYICLNGMWYKLMTMPRKHQAHADRLKEKHRAIRRDAEESEAAAAVETLFERLGRLRSEFDKFAILQKKDNEKCAAERAALRESVDKIESALASPVGRPVVSTV